MPRSTRALAATAAACHEHMANATEAGAACPMHKVDGAACPMSDRAKGADCSGMRQRCAGSGAALASLFAFLGDFADPPHTAAVLLWTPATVAAPALLVPVPHAADAPPPKA